MKKILLVFGTRPEAIKMAPLYHALKGCPSDFDVKVCVTAQHRDMLDQVLRVFNVKPDIDLDLMRPKQNLFDITANVLTQLKVVLNDEKPDMVLVHGDTTTAFSAALAAFYLDIPVGHVEAGLRTKNIRSPFPEEMNRQFIAKLSTLHFAPTKISAENLHLEGVPANSIKVTGNTVIDALNWTIKRLRDNPLFENELCEELEKLLSFPFRLHQYVLITGHRRENFGEGFAQITAAIAELAELFPNIRFVYAVHLNPNVTGPVTRVLSNFSNVHLIPPQQYQSFAVLLRYCLLVLTDSGGLQEEAPSLGKPVLVMRDVTERPEAVEFGTVKLVGARHDQIVQGVKSLVYDEMLYESMARAHNPYGDGKACERIIKKLKEFFYLK